MWISIIIIYYWFLPLHGLLEKAGDIHLASRENVINIRNTSWEDVIYKGQVIRYRIILSISMILGNTIMQSIRLHFFID